MIVPRKNITDTLFMIRWHMLHGDTEVLWFWKTMIEKTELIYQNEDIKK